eukprot:2350925-Amphidinium_carterae.1
MPCPHLDDYPEWYSDGTLSSGCYPESEQEDESGEEEAREQQEVEDRPRIGAYINPHVIVANQLPVEAVKRLPRPSVVNPRRPPSEPAEEDDYSLGSDQVDEVIENLAQSRAEERNRSTRRAAPHPPLVVRGHTVIDGQGRVNSEGLHAVVLEDRARIIKLRLRQQQEDAPLPKAMPRNRSAAAVAPAETEMQDHRDDEEAGQPDVDQVLKMEEDAILLQDGYKDDTGGILTAPKATGVIFTEGIVSTFWG